MTEASDWFAKRTQEEIGKRVHTWPWDGPVFHGTIVAGDFSTGRWEVENDRGERRTILGPHMQEDES